MKVPIGMSMVKSTQLESIVYSGAMNYGAYCGRLKYSDQQVQPLNGPSFGVSISA